MTEEKTNVEPFEITEEEKKAIIAARESKDQMDHAKRLQSEIDRRATERIPHQLAVIAEVRTLLETAGIEICIYQGSYTFDDVESGLEIAGPL